MKAANMENTNILNGIPLEYHGCDFNAINGVDPVREWVRNSNGFLFIYGPTGTGKTHLSCAIKKRCNELGLNCRLIFTSDLFLQIKNSFDSKDERSGDIIFNVAPDNKLGYISQLTIFDDIGAQKITDYVKEVWYNIIERRLRFGCKTIFTSNYKISEISDVMGDRIASRLASGYNFELSGEDRRIRDIGHRDLTKIF